MPESLYLNDLEETAMIVGSVTGLINNSNFDDASMAYEDMVAAQMNTTNFSQSLNDLGQAGNDIDQAIINKDADGRNTVLDGVTGIFRRIGRWI